MTAKLTAPSTTKPANSALKLTRLQQVWLVVSIALAGVGVVALVAVRPADVSVAPNGVLPSEPVTAMNLQARLANNSPSLVADPTDPRFVVVANRIDGPDFSCALQLSGDSGRDWVQANVASPLPHGVDKCYAPEAAFDRTGRLCYLFVGLAGNGNDPVGAFLTYSTDRGRTFAPARQVLGADRFMVRMAIDPGLGPQGRIYLAWLQDSSPPTTGGFEPTDNPIMTAFTDDGGATFSKPVRVSSSVHRRAVAPALAVGADHHVHIAFYDLNGDARDYQGLDGPTWPEDWTLLVATSVDDGAHFGPDMVVDGSVRPGERVMLIYTMPPPSIATDDSGRVFVAWDDATNGDRDVFLRRSTDGGQTWSSRVRLNDDPVHDRRDQYLPRLSVAPGGRVDAIFYDRRSNWQNRGNDVYYTFSTDGGAHFSPNVKLTSINFDSEVGPRYSVPSAHKLVEFGSRMALVSTDDHVLAAWTDTRNDARVFTAQDIFATDVMLASGESPPWLAIVLFGMSAAIVAALALPRLMSLLRGRRREAGDA
jgi:hypothetical protein